MRPLMFGWEFPPYISGGLGTACFGLTRAMARLGIDIIFVLPRIKGEKGHSHVKLVSASDVPALAEFEREQLLQKLEFRIIDSILKPYINEKDYERLVSQSRLLKGPQYEEEEEGAAELSGSYGPNLINEVIRYGEIASTLSKRETFDIIHSHDWMTAFAGARAKRSSGKPFVYHAHALEYDRSGEDINPDIYNIERFGMEAADHVIAVSHFTKGQIVNRYGIPEEKISVVHNAVSRSEGRAVLPPPGNFTGKVVLFLGRITFQKGPDYFVEAAAKVIKAIPDVTFVMAGSGDMMPRMIERVAQLGIGRNFHFTGFLQGADVERIYAMSDLYVMPSVSEPFGISPLEAMLYDVPVIISRQSGVSEILRHALKVNFWDIDELADKMIAALKYPSLIEELKKGSRQELDSIHWKTAAEKVCQVYKMLAG